MRWKLRRERNGKAGEAGKTNSLLLPDFSSVRHRFPRVTLTRRQTQLFRIQSIQVGGGWIGTWVLTVLVARQL